MFDRAAGGIKLYLENNPLEQFSAVSIVKPHFPFNKYGLRVLISCINSTSLGLDTSFTSPYSVSEYVEINIRLQWIKDIILFLKKPSIHVCYPLSAPIVAFVWTFPWDAFLLLAPDHQNQFAAQNSD